MTPTPIKFKDIRVGDKVQVKTLCYNKITTNTFEGIAVRVYHDEVYLGDPDREFECQDVVAVGPAHFSRGVEYFLVDRPIPEPVFLETRQDPKTKTVYVKTDDSAQASWVAVAGRNFCAAYTLFGTNEIDRQIINRLVPWKP